MDKLRPIASDYNETYDIHPEIRGEVKFIITGQDWTGWRDIEADGKPVYLNPGKMELMDIVLHKARVINNMDVEKFYENDSAQVALLKTMCPKCRIIQVREGATAF